MVSENDNTTTRTLRIPMVRPGMYVFLGEDELLTLRDDHDTAGFIVIAVFFRLVSYALNIIDKFSLF